jgi:hypothetical protein
MFSSTSSSEMKPEKRDSLRAKCAAAARRQPLFVTMKMSASIIPHHAICTLGIYSFSAFMRGGFIFRSRGPSLKVLHSQCLTSMITVKLAAPIRWHNTKYDSSGPGPGYIKVCELAYNSGPSKSQLVTSSSLAGRPTCTVRHLSVSARTLEHRL